MAEAFRKEIFLGKGPEVMKMEILGELIPCSDVKADKERFGKFCREGCPNYNRNYSCPPHSQTFADYVKGFDYLFGLMFCVSSADERKPPEARVIEKKATPFIEKLLSRLEKAASSKAVAARSCSICVPCRKSLGEPCPSPEDMRHDMVSLGVDCANLAEKVFGRKILWDKNGKGLEYVSFVCGVPVKEVGQKEKLLKILSYGRKL